MEKILSEEDRIRRAEEIYYRRNNINAGKTATVNLNPKREYKLFKKIIIQIIICAGIYSGIYLMQKNTDNFSIDSINYIKTTLGYDVDIEGWVKTAKNYIEAWMPLKETKNEDTKIEEKPNDTPEETLAVAEENTQNVEEVKEQPEVIEETSSISQMEQDAEYIKANFSLIKPVTGTITSRFGLRNPTTATVPKYHTGIDIAVPEGTVYVAAMDGVVELVSSQGDYRKSCENNKWRCNDSLCTLQNHICKRRG